MKTQPTAVYDARELGLPRMAVLGVASSSLVYFVISGFVKACGVKRVMRFFPPVATGPIIIGIILNAILPGKDFEFDETAPSIKDAERFGGVKN